MEHDVANTAPRAQLICNGREALRRDTPCISNVPSILMFTLSLGGWDNSPLEDAHLPIL